MKYLNSCTFQSNLVSLEGRDSLAEQLFCVDITALHTGDIDLLPFNGNVVRLEDLANGLRDFAADTVTFPLGQYAGIVASSL